MASIIVVLQLLMLTILSSAWSDDLNNDHSKSMVFVPGGNFFQGLSEGERDWDQNPEESVYLDSFFIDKFEVTNAEYKQCVAAGACGVPSLIVDYPPAFFQDGKKWFDNPTMQNYPVVGITWQQAVIFCRWSGKRLPTKAEWEKAARGFDKRNYPWGKEWHEGKANWNEEGMSDGFVRLAPVGSYPLGASPFGVMDMAGNVREWVDNQILKGGSWHSYKYRLRIGDPGHKFIVQRDDDMGFRCAKDFTPEISPNSPHDRPSNLPSP